MIIAWTRFLLSFQSVRNTGLLSPRYLHFKRNEAQTLVTSFGCKSLRHWVQLALGEMFLCSKGQSENPGPFPSLFQKAKVFFFLPPFQRGGDGCLSPMCKQRKSFFPSLVYGVKPATHERIAVALIASPVGLVSGTDPAVYSDHSSVCISKECFPPSKCLVFLWYSYI